MFFLNGTNVTQLAEEGFIERKLILLSFSGSSNFSYENYFFVSEVL